MASESLPPRRADAVITPVQNDLRRSGQRDAVIEPVSETSELARRWEVIRRHIPALAIAALLGAGAGWWVQHNTGPVYRATTTVRFSDTRARVTSGVGDASQNDNGWQWDPVKSQAELLTTRATLEGAAAAGMLQLQPVGSESLAWVTALEASQVESTDTLVLNFDSAGVKGRYRGENAASLYGMPLTFKTMSLTVPAKPPVATARFVVSGFEDVIGHLGNVKVNRRQDTDIADFSLDGSEPKFVQRALNALTLSLQMRSQASDKLFAQERRRFLDEQSRKTDSLLQSQRDRLTAFRTVNQTFNAKDRVSQEQQSLATLRTRREELAADRDVFQSLLTTALAARDAGDPARLKSLVGAPGIGDNKLIADLFSKLQDLSSTRDSLTKGPFASSGTNPDVLRVTSRIESTTEDLIAAVRSQINTFDARIKALDGLETKAAAQVSTLPTTEAQEDRLIQEAAATQKIADQLTEEQQKARIAEVAQGGKVEVIDLARLPQRVVGTGIFRRTALGSVLGVLIALALVFLYEEVNTSLRRKTDIERLLSLPTLGSIPALDRQVASGGSKVLKRIGAGKPARNGTAISKQSASPVFESYRGIRTSLIFSNAVESLRSIAITSSSPGDGKSTTVANLATAFAQQGLRVLAIDCDLRRGSLHRIFGVARAPGLTHAIATGSGLESVTRESGIPNLWVVTTGVQPPNPGELLGSNRLRELLAEAQEQFDLVVIDTPPVLAAADAAIVASMVDGVILLIRVGTTTKSAAKASQERLQLVGARILGTVLNDPTEMLDSTQEYYYYDYSSAGSST